MVLGMDGALNLTLNLVTHGFKRDDRQILDLLIRIRDLIPRSPSVWRPPAARQPEGESTARLRRELQEEAERRRAAILRILSDAAFRVAEQLRAIRRSRPALAPLSDLDAAIELWGEVADWLESPLSGRSDAISDPATGLTSRIEQSSRGPLGHYLGHTHPIRFLEDLRRFERRRSLSDDTYPSPLHYAERFAASWKLGPGHKERLAQLAESQGRPRKSVKKSIVEAAIVLWLTALRLETTVRIGRRWEKRSNPMHPFSTDGTNDAVRSRIEGGVVDRLGAASRPALLELARDLTPEKAWIAFRAGVLGEAKKALHSGGVSDGVSASLREDLIADERATSETPDEMLIDSVAAVQALLQRASPQQRLIILARADPALTGVFPGLDGEERRALASQCTSGAEVGRALDIPAYQVRKQMSRFRRKAE